MKSYINSMADIKDAPIEKEVIIRFPFEEMEKKLRAISRLGKKTISPDTIEKGDVVVLSLESELPRFNKKAAFVTAGGGLLSPELEETLLGRRAGDTYEAEAEGTPVRVTVKQISRTIFPEPTDDMVKAYVEAHDEFEGISSLEEYKARVIDNYFEEAHEEAYYNKVEEVMDYLLTHSDFEFDEDELEALDKQAMDFTKEELAEEGKTLEGLSEKEMLGYFGVSTQEEVREMIRINSEREIGTALIIAKVNDMDVKEISYEEFAESYYGIDFIDEYLKEALTIKEER